MKIAQFIKSNYQNNKSISIYTGQKVIVELLIRHGADVNAKNKDDKTALNLASEKGIVNNDKSNSITKENKMKIFSFVGEKKLFRFYMYKN